MDLESLNKYEILKKETLEDIKSEGVLLKHKKSGAHICILNNDDENKVFFAGFRTPPHDSTGIPHIVEHTVLCGSRKFPLKDPFIELVKGSMNTFLNAITFPDKTLYPVASCNDKDFRNLMDVYLDSVFYPNIYNEENIFKQEGWHYELEDPDDELKVTGIVYNEMKGAFSSADGVLEREILRSLYPDTSYANESGGDPAVIPDLTYEKYLDFHRTYYHPSNCYIYLYGNINVNDELEWLDREYLSKFDSINVDSEIGVQKPFKTPHETTGEYSISSSESEENNTFLSCSWSIGNNLDREQYIAFEILDFALLNCQGAPVKQALNDEGIGAEIYGGYDNGTYQPVFTITAKNANISDKERFKSIIEDVLKRQVENGINKKTLLAALNSSEFRFREADFGRYPKGLMRGLTVMDSWLYDKNEPFLHLDELSVYASLRDKINTGYFEDLVKKYLIDNNHKSYIYVLPKKGLNTEKERLLKEKLAAYKSRLSKEEIKELIQQTEDLKNYKNTPSDTEDLKKLPMLSREDMKRTESPYSNIMRKPGGCQNIIHDYDSNGIIYQDLLFDIHHIEQKYLPYLGVLRNLLGKLDTQEYSYQDITDEINLYTGGIKCELNVFPAYKASDGYTAKFEIRMKSVQANYEKALKLTESIIFRTKFSDEKRIRTLLSESKSRLQSELSENGHTVSVNRALSYYSPRAKFSDMTGGIGYYRLLEKLSADFEDNKSKMYEILNTLIKRIFIRQNLTISTTCTLAEAVSSESGLVGFTDNIPDGEKEAPVNITPEGPVNEGFMDASQIQYVSLAGRFDDKKPVYSGALRIFKSLMSYEYLWERIRVEGSAYGCAAGSTHTGDIFFTSYRDPNLSRTLDVYRKVPEYLEHFDADERTMTKFIIGTFSEIDAPLTPISKGRRSLLAYLSSQALEDVQRERIEILDAHSEDIRKLAPLVKKAIDNSYICVIGNEDKLRSEEDIFDIVKNLNEK